METSKIKSSSNFDINVILKLSEIEARALHGIVQYGSASFLEVFYTHLGRICLEDHEKGIISLFETIKTELPKHLKKADMTRKIWRENT